MGTAGAESYVGLVAVIGLFCGLIAGVIAERKQRSAAGFFVLGLILGIFGILAAAIVQPGRPSAPEGLVAVRCPRCNAEQNVPALHPSFECWQCHLHTSIPQAAISPPKVQTPPAVQVAKLFTVISFTLILIGIPVTIYNRHLLELKDIALFLLSIGMFAYGMWLLRQHADRGKVILIAPLFAAAVWFIRIVQALTIGRP